MTEKETRINVIDCPFCDKIEWFSDNCRSF